LPDWANDAVQGTITCAPKVLERLNFRVLGGIAAKRIYNLEISDAGFLGRLDIGLGPGSGEIAIHSAGPINIVLNMWRSPTVSIDAGTTINHARIVADDADIRIGKDNLWSDEVLVQTNDQHGIIDLDRGELIRTGRMTFETEEHVWIGRRATLMPNLRIGAGAIVGAASVVTRDISPITAVGGNPARVIRRNTTWSRSPIGPTEAESRNIAEIARRHPPCG
jgi:acetyltransferase-like isoleucine patch superfamily enzyme